MRRLTFRSNESLLAAALLVSCFIVSSVLVSSAPARVDPRPLDLGDPDDLQGYQTSEKALGTCLLHDVYVDPMRSEDGIAPENEGRSVESRSWDNSGRAGSVVHEAKWLLAARLILISLGIRL